MLIIVCYISQSLLVIQISNVQNAGISHGHLLRPLRFSQLALMTMPPNFLGQTNLKARIPLILLILVGYSSPSLLVIWISNVQNVEISIEHP